MFHIPKPMAHKTVNIRTPVYQMLSNDIFVKFLMISSANITMHKENHDIKKKLYII